MHWPFRRSLICWLALALNLLGATANLPSYSLPPDLPHDLLSVIAQIQDEEGTEYSPTPQTIQEPLPETSPSELPLEREAEAKPKEEIRSTAPATAPSTSPEAPSTTPSTVPSTTAPTAPLSPEDETSAPPQPSINQEEGQDHYPMAHFDWMELAQTRTIGSPIPARPLRASDASKTEDNKKEAIPLEAYTINFNNVPIIEYVRFVSDISGVNFLFNAEDLNFSVTIVSDEPTSIENIVSALLQILQVKGLRTSEQGNQIIIYKNADLAKIGAVVEEEGGMDSTSYPILTRVFRISFGSVKELEKIIIPLLSDQAIVQSSEETGHLIVTDIVGNIQRVGTLLEALDSPTPDDRMVEYHVRHQSVETLLPIAQKVLAPLGGSAITLVPQASTNTIFIVATPLLAERAISILQTIDIPPLQQEMPYLSERSVDERGEKLPPYALARERLTERPYRPDADLTSFYIYKLQFHQGDEIKEALRDIAESLESSLLPSQGADSKLINTIRTIQWIKASNSLVISGDRPSIEKVKELIADLDIPLEQVYVEVLVIRTTIANALTIGVEWGYASTFDSGPGPNSDVVQSAFGSTQGSPGGVPSTLNQRLNPRVEPAPINPLPEGVAGGIVGRFVSFNGKLFNSIGAIVNALQSDQDTRILLNPKIMTQDNHTARQFVGSNVAFRESTVSEPGSTILSGQILYRNVGSELIITPLLNNGDMITLEISQRVEDFENSAADLSGNGSGTTEPIQKTETETRVTVPDGYFLVLSGQIENEQQTVHRGLPCLGGLPIIGTAFSTRSTSDTRDSLILFIRPHKIRNKADMVRITEHERTDFERHSAQREFQIDREEALDLLNIRHRGYPTPDHYCDPCYTHDPCETICCP